MLNGYFDLIFDVSHAAGNDRSSDNNDIRLVNLGPIALFSNDKLTSSSGEHLEDISHAHVVSLLYKLITIAKDTDDLSIGFDRGRKRKRRQMTDKKNQKNKFHVRIMLKSILCFSEHQ